MDELLNDFIEETSELLMDMEDKLLSLEEDPEDIELINSVFRAAHTIKGTADIMNFKQIRSFTHILENNLDKVRKGEVSLDKNLITFLLTCQDHINSMVVDVVSKGHESEEWEARSEALIMELEKEFSGQDYSHDEISAKPVADEEDSTDAPSESKVSEKIQSEEKFKHWQVILKYHAEALKNGVDPVAVLAYIRQIFKIEKVDCDVSRIPDAKVMDPTDCYLDFYLDVSTELKTKNEIEQTFEYVSEYCDINISGYDETNENSIKTIESLPPLNYSLGEILVRSGAIDYPQLDKALLKQKTSQENKLSSPPLGEMLVKEGVVDGKVLGAALKKQSSPVVKKVATSSNLRIKSEKLDQLINLVGELIIASDRSRSLVQEMGDKRLIESIDSISSLMESIRDRSLQMRMVPIGDTFDRFQRVVRDVSRDLGKDIVLYRHGGETELDRTIVEKISDPLMHLIRNAIDHGVESPEERLAKGKSERGEITLNAFHDSGGIVIEIKDDGRGMDTEIIFQKALAKGLVNESFNMTDQDIYRLIFEPGFSTTDQVTNISGRGVGMDVVKKNVESLHGHIDIQSELGKGSTMTLRLPLTLAVISGFMIAVGNNKYVIPLDMVQECFELTDDLLENEQFINIRGDAIPVIRLRELFKCSEGDADDEHVVVVHFAEQSVGLVVDKLYGERQTVIKPLGSIFKHLKGISGSTILGNGQVVMILDIPDLLNLLRGSKRQSQNRGQVGQPV